MNYCLRSRNLEKKNILVVKLVLLHLLLTLLIMY
nr:MAG TPA: hypothetical protein [Caudoviricetes sp.]